MLIVLSSIFVVLRLENCLSTTVYNQSIQHGGTALNGIGRQDETLLRLKRMFLRSLLITLWLLLATARLSSSSSSDQDSNDIGMVPTGTLHNGVVVPLVGLGCASGVRGQAVSDALSIGYRFVDTAMSYSWGYHEDEVGDAVQKFRKKLPNESVFVQTKIHPEDLGYEATKRAVRISLQRHGVESIDSVLIHKPRCWEGACTKVPEGTWQDSWKALEEFYEAGIITKSIGICDVSSPDLLNKLLLQKIKPHIIQNWMDPFHQDKRMRKLIQDNGILYQAYSSLGTQWYHHKGHSKNPVINDPTLMEIAAAHGADVGQVVVHWATIRHGISVLPASKNSVRQEGNLHHSFQFVLTEEELDRIDDLDGNVPKVPDTNEVSIEFQSKHDAEGSPQTIDVYWINTNTNIKDNEEVHIGSIGPGKTLSLNSYHGHTFRFKDPTGSTTNAYKDHTVEKGKGNQQIHLISFEDDEEL